MTMDAPVSSVEITAMPDRRLKPGPRHDAVAADPNGVEIGLSAAIVTVREDEPEVLTVPGLPGTRPHHDARQPELALPSGTFSPRDHRTLEAGLRSWVNEQTDLDLGYVEQLYTFGDRGRLTVAGDAQPHTVSIGYLALVRPNTDDAAGGTWRSWYDFFPWEDWRNGKPAILSQTIEPLLDEWAAQPDNLSAARGAMTRRDRLRVIFGMNGGTFDEEKVLDRFELLYEAGLIEEAWRDGHEATRNWQDLPALGRALQYDHRRILATSIGRTRAKIKYRPVVFELMPAEFTLFELQKTVEAILGPHLHKQNFRRLVESAGLVDATGEVRVKTGGRPARLYRFRHEVLLERPAPGVRVNLNRAN